MEEIVRAILNSRTISLEPVEKNFNIYGFKCLGVAEKLLDLDDLSGSSVYIWHVKSDILPVSKNEIERWSIDAPGNKHWILSERIINNEILESLPDDFTLIINGVNTEITSPMCVNYANDTHTYQFLDRPDNLIRLLHIDYGLS